MNRAELKEKAKQQLGNDIFGNVWLMSTLIFLIYEAIVAVLNSLNLGILAILVSGPLSYGLVYIFLKQSNDNQAPAIEDLFKGFKEDFTQNFLIGLMTSIFTFLWALLFVIPGMVKAYAYSLAYFIKVDNPSYNWKQCIDESIKMTNGHKLDLFILDLSFIGWYIVGALCFGVGILFVMPYHYATRIQYYEKLKSN